MHKSEPIHPRHQDIRNDQGWLHIFDFFQPIRLRSLQAWRNNGHRIKAFNSFQRLDPVMRGDYLIALETQGHFKQFQNVQDIFYDENGTLIDSHGYILVPLKVLRLIFCPLAYPSLLLLVQRAEINNRSPTGQFVFSLQLLERCMGIIVTHYYKKWPTGCAMRSRSARVGRLILYFPDISFGRL